MDTPTSSGVMTNQFLLVIDFDYTVTAKNTDDWLLQSLLTPDKVKEITSQWYSNTVTWQQLMINGFKALHEQSTPPDAIFKILEEIPLVNGFGKFLELVGNSKDCRVIIASDSNTVFIDTIFKKHGLEKFVDAVLTNPAHFDEDNHLRLSPHHSHSCTTCQPNICKQEILRLYLKQEKEKGHHYERIFVIGDGGNDFCPCNLLKEGDGVFPRKGYRLMKKLDALKDNGKSVKATVAPWEDGVDLLTSFIEVSGLNLE